MSKYFLLHQQTELLLFEDSSGMLPVLLGGYRRGKPVYTVQASWYSGCKSLLGTVGSF